MFSLKHVLSVSAVSALLATGALAMSAAPAAARVVCNNGGDCWHSDTAPARVPGIQFNVHPDDWYFHQKWDNSDRHYRDYHEGRGYYKGGVWIGL
jgi:hypothetical protein